MKRLREFSVTVALFLLLSPAMAEVSIGGDSASLGFLFASGGDDPDPWPHRWDIIRTHVDPGLILNAYGDANGDGAPAFGMNPVTGAPEVVWSWWDGNDHEIALSRWQETGGWSEWEILTDNDVDDLDPSISIDELGTRRVSWWRAGAPDQVWFTEQSAGTDGWSGEERVTVVVEAGLRPSVIEESGVVRVAYQRQAASATEIVVSTRQGGWHATVVASTSYAGPEGDGDIDVQIHTRDGRIWIDWVDSGGFLAFSVFDPQTDTWSIPDTESYFYDPGLGETEYWEREGARVRIRRRVLR